MLLDSCLKKIILISDYKNTTVSCQQLNIKNSQVSFNRAIKNVASTPSNHIIPEENKIFSRTGVCK